MAEIFWECVLGVALPLIVYGLLAWARSAGVRRRLAAGGTHVVMRLRAPDPAYPGFWRPGWLSVSTGMWRPTVPWAEPISMSGVRVTRYEDAPTEGLLRIAENDDTFVCVDREGRPFQVAAHPDEADVARGALIEAAMTRAPKQRRRTLRRLLLNRVPFWMVATTGAALLWMAYWMAPLLDVSTAEAVIVESRADHVCIVRVIATGTEGAADCGVDGVLPPGEPITVTVVGWPRSGVPDEVMDGLFLGPMPMTVVLFLCGIVLWGEVKNRRAFVAYWQRVSARR